MRLDFGKKGLDREKKENEKKRGLRRKKEEKKIDRRALWEGNWEEDDFQKWPWIDRARDKKD